MNIVALAGLMKMELPSGDVLLCDGGRIDSGGDTFTGKDAVFGTIGAMESLAEGVGSEVPSLQMTLLPQESANISDLLQEGFQTSRVRFWIAEFDQDTGAVIGSADLQFDGQVDQVILTRGRDKRDLAVTVVSNAERLLTRADGNTVSPTFHKSVWPGETGHDQATGLTIPVAWGAEAAVTGGASPLGAPMYGGLGI